MNRVCLSVCLAALIYGCSEPESVSGSRAALPVSENQPVSVGADGFQSEQSMVRVLYDGEPGILAAYNDLTNNIAALYSTGKYDQVAGLSEMGLSVYLDATGTWAPQEQLPVPAGLYELRGDPWLATDAQHEIVWYVNLARTSASSPCAAADAIAWAASNDGGVTWEPIRWFEPGACVDKPSVAIGDRVGDGVDDVTVHIAYVHEGDGEIEVITKPAGASTFDAPVRVPGDGAAKNPIIRDDPGSSNYVYVAYQELPFVTGPGGNLRIAFAGSSDGGASFQFWSYVDDHIAVDAPLAANEQELRTGIFQYFVVDPDNLHCLVAYQRGRTVMFASTTNGATWAKQAITDEGVLGFQPALAASGGKVALVWYEQQDGTRLVRMRGAVSPNNGVSWPSAQTLSVDSAGADVYFEPCPFDGGNGWYFGDYVGLVPVDYPEPTGRFYASWADSREAWGTPTCDWGDINTAHQHTMGVLFE